jgi:hypothetical protein
VPAQQAPEAGAELPWETNPHALARTMPVDVDADWVRITNEWSAL